MNRLIELILRWWIQRTKEQKILLCYITVLSLLIFLFPFLRLQQLDAVEAKNIWFLGSGMFWLQVVVILSLIKLVGLNVSTKRKKTAYRLLWWNNNDHLDNVMILAFLLLMMLTMSETIGLYSQQVSTVITPTWTVLVVELFLLAGIARQLMLTRLQWKKANTKNAHTSTTKIPHERDTSNKESMFSSSSHHQDKSLEGLFGKE